MPQPPATHVMRLPCAEADARAVAELMMEMLDPDHTAAACYEIEATTAHWNATPWMAEVYFSHAPDEAQVLALVALAVGPALAAAAQFGLVEQRDWVASALEGLSAVRAGRFLVHGAHERAKVRGNDIGLEIEAALAFGTGHHGTTRGCLLLLERVLKRRRPRGIIDVGTGSGVLALAAALALKRQVAAGDIDPASVAAARGNALANGAGAFLRPVLARGVQHPALQARRFDLAFANILARPLRLLATSLAARAAPGAELILSGLLARDVAGVLAAYRAQGFFLRQRLDLEGWACLLLRDRSNVAIAPRRARR